tara:strand:+ start:30 stop:1643 length:1614 start_codon:yes stop_codon:yes gene_type:complete
MAPITDPGQRRDDLERERLRLRQQEERSRQAQEQRKKAELLQMQQMQNKKQEPLYAKGQPDPRQQALQNMAKRGVEKEESEYPTIPKPAETETDIHAVKQAPQEKADVSQSEQLSKAEKEVKESVQQGKEQQLQEMNNDKGDPIYDKDGNVVGYQSKGSQGQWVYDAKTGKKYSSHGLAGALGLDEVYDEAGESATYPGVSEPDKEAQESGKDWLYDPETGEKVGWKVVGGEDEGQFYDMSGTPVEFAPDNAITKDLYEEKFPGKASYDKTMSQFTEWLNQKTGIPEEQLQGQIAQVHMQSSDQIAKFANLMAARGAGASGLMGAGMGQIASQAVAAIANIKFENEKMKIEEKLNKMKTAAALAGQWMSEENRMKIFEEMSQLDEAKFDWQKKQDENANFWADLNDTAALLQAKDGWDDTALAKAQAAKEAGMTAAEVQQHLFVAGNKVTWQGDDPPGYGYKGEVKGEDPVMAKEGELWEEQSDAQKLEITNAFQMKVMQTGQKPQSVTDVYHYMKEWFGWNIDEETAQNLWNIYGN